MLGARKQVVLGGDDFRDEYSLVFDGSNDVINCSLIDLDTNDVSISVWAKPAAYANDVAIFSNRLNSGAYIGIEIGLSASSNTIRLDFDYGGTTVQSKNTGYLTDRWYHIVGVWDRSDKQFLYIDGVLVDSDDISGQASTDLTHAREVFIGRNHTNAEFTGNISEVTYYDGTALSALEVKTIYNDREPYNHKEGVLSGNLTQWWRMGDGRLDKYASNGTVGLIGDEVNPILGPELIDASVVYTEYVSADGWTEYADNNLSFPGGTAIRCTAGTSANDNGAFAYLRSATRSITSANLDVNSVYKFSCQMTTNDNAQHIEISDGSDAGGTYYSTDVSGNGYKEIYFITKSDSYDSSGPFIRFDGMVDDKYIELSEISLVKVSGNAGVMINMDAVDFKGDTP